MSGTDMARWARTPAQLAIARFEQMKAILAETKTVDEAKQIVDQAEALRVFVRQRQLGLEVQNLVAELRLLAERRLGETLMASRKNRGGRPPEENPSSSVTGYPGKPPTYGDLGIQRNEAARAQRFARIPAEVFARAVEGLKGAGAEITFAALRRAVRDEARASGAQSGEAPPAGPTPFARFVALLDRARVLVARAAGVEGLTAEERSAAVAVLDAFDAARRIVHTDVVAETGAPA